MVVNCYLHILLWIIFKYMTCNSLVDWIFDIPCVPYSLPIFFSGHSNRVREEHLSLPWMLFKPLNQLIYVRISPIDMWEWGVALTEKDVWSGSLAACGCPQCLSALVIILICQIHCLSIRELIRHRGQCLVHNNKKHVYWFELQVWVLPETNLRTEMDREINRENKYLVVVLEKITEWLSGWW